MSLRSPIRSLINALGTTVVFENQGTMTYDPETGLTTLGTGDSLAAKADVMPTQQRQDLEVRDGDLTVTVPYYPGFRISSSTTATLGCVNYRVLLVKELWSFGEISAWEAMLRRIGDG